MVQYECPRCGYTSHVMTNFKVHLRRVTPCEDLFCSDLSCADILKSLEKDRSGFKYECPACQMRFPYRQGLFAHKTTCKLFDLFKQGKLDINPETASTSTASTSTASTSTSNTSNAKVVCVKTNKPKVASISFGNEIINDIPRNIIENCIKTIDTTGLKDLIDYIYFNPDKKENHTIKFEDNSIIVKNDTWLKKEIDQVLRPITRKCYQAIATIGCPSFHISKQFIARPQDLTDRIFEIIKSGKCNG